MKRQVSLVAMILGISYHSLAQNPGSAAKTHWNTNGNATGETDFIGTVNASPLQFKTNNQLQGLFDAQGNFLLKNDMIVNGKLNINGGFNLGGQDGIGVTKTASGTTFTYGLSSKTALAPAAVCAALPYPPVNHMFGGWLQIFQADGTGNYVPGSGLMNLQTWANGSSIDASVGGNSGGGGLLLNYFCGNNTFINTGSLGGTVFMGEKVDMKRSLKIGWSSSGVIDPNTAIEINQSAPNLNTIKLNTWDNSMKFLTINNSNFANSPFTVYSNGRTHIGHLKQTTGAHTDAMLTVNGKMVAKSCYITLSNWADYVFDENYVVPNLYSIEKYYKEHKHLPEIPSAAEVIENGIEVGEMNMLLLKKIEEMTLIMVQQQKELDELKTKIK